MCTQLEYARGAGDRHGLGLAAYQAAALLGCGAATGAAAHVALHGAVPVVEPLRGLRAAKGRQRPGRQPAAQRGQAVAHVLLVQAAEAAAAAEEVAVLLRRRGMDTMMISLILCRYRLGNRGACQHMWCCMSTCREGCAYFT